MVVKAPHKPSPMEAALLLLHLAEVKEQERMAGPKGDESRKDFTRFRVSETTLKQLCGRQRIPLDYLTEVQEWLLDAGWALFFAGSSYAMIKNSSVDGWTRLSWKRIQREVDQVLRGEFKFENLYYLLNRQSSAAED
jgi:hypothetical protein